MSGRSLMDSLSSGFSNFTNNVSDGFSNIFSVGSEIGPDNNMKPDDVLKTKSALSSLGSYSVPDFGITDTPDQNMIHGLKSFQADQGLKVDGIMKPGGPTEAALAQNLSEKGINNTDLLEQAKATQPPSLGDLPDDSPVSASASVNMDSGKVSVSPANPAPSDLSAPTKPTPNPMAKKQDPLKKASDFAKSMKKVHARNAEIHKPKETMSENKPLDVENHLDDFKGMEERPTHYSPEREKTVLGQIHDGLEKEAVEDLQNIIMNDPDGFAKFPTEIKSGYAAYQDVMRKNFRPDRTPAEQAQVQRNAIEAFRKTAAQAYTGEEVLNNLYDVDQNVRRGIATLRGADPDELADIDKSHKRNIDRIGMPRMYKDKTVGRYIDDVVEVNPAIGSTAAIGKMSKELQKMGLSPLGVQVGSTVMGLVNGFGGKGVKLSKDQISNLLSNQFGKDWFKRLAPKEMEFINDQILGKGLDYGAQEGIKSFAGDGKKQF